jgi:hypothetical protein
MIVGISSIFAEKKCISNYDNEQDFYDD